MRKLFLFLSFFVSCTLISGQGMAQCIADLCHCDTARSQSPIDINTHSVRSTKKNPFKFSFCDKRQTYHYKLANTTGLIPDSVNTIVYEGATYQLLQVHTHLPGEHTINGVSYDFELHYVFQNTGAGKDFIVIAIYGNIEAGTSPPPATSYQQCRAQ
jgi:carbonic anhydrase